MILDLTKPLRVKNTHPVRAWRGKRFYPARMEGVVNSESIGILEDEDEWQIIDIDNLENIPKIVRIERWVNVYHNTEYHGAAHPTEDIANNCTLCNRLGNPVHLIFCHDPETGKTWAEVPKEES